MNGYLPADINHNLQQRLEQEMKTVHSQTKAAAYEADELSRIIAVGRRRARLLEGAASNSSVPEVLAAAGARVPVILWDEAEIALAATPSSK